MNKRILRTVVIVGVAVGLGETLAFGNLALRANVAYTWMRRLILKGSDAAADELARRAIAAGEAHERYELETTPCMYWDHRKGVYRSEPWPETYRLMWLDPVTRTQHFETHIDGVRRDREPFYYVLHNRAFTCQSTGDPNNSYAYSIFAGAQFALINKVALASPGREVLFHPIRYEFGMTTLPAECTHPSEPVGVTEQGSLILARASSLTRRPVKNNVDVHYLMAWYDSTN